jgi:hypothetical protein
LYPTRSHVSTNMHTFVAGGGSDRYKCEANTFVSDGATTRYKCEVFVPSGLEEAPTRPYEGTFVPGGGSNRYRCPHLYRGKKSRHKN